jgi:sterol desaturase/sphingolipid hydroxylase (fatty acid hydroxylase superfamily)
MSELHIALLLLLCVINYPFVWLVDQVVRARNIARVYAVPVDAAQLRRERLNALHTTPIHPAVLAIAVLSGGLRLSADSLLAVAGTFALTFVWTEVYHYWLHRAMHVKSLHFTHREHHRSRITNAWTSISFSVWEEFLFAVGVAVFLAAVSRWVPLSLVGVVIYYLVYFSTNTVGHANIEFNAPGYGTTFLGKLFTSSGYHAMHHARYINNYGLLTRVMDRLCNTEWPDSDAVQTRAARGQPLGSLRERADGSNVHSRAEADPAEAVAGGALR